MREICKKINLLEPINADEINITRDNYFKNAYLIDLPLDSVPDHAWQDIFDREWRSSRSLWDRKLFIINDKLRFIIAAPDEIGEKIDWIRRVINQTNSEIDGYNRTVPVEKHLRKNIVLGEEDRVAETVRDVLRRKLEASFAR